MADEHADTRRRAMATASRLRLIQFDFADDEPDARKRFLREELDRSLQGVAPDQRRAFLEELEAHFPSWDARVEVAERPDEELRSTSDERELRDASFLVSRLLEVLPDLSPGETQVVRDRLAAAGLVGDGPVAQWRDDVERNLRLLLGSTEQTSHHPERALAIADLLVKSVTDLYKLVWEWWQEAAPRTKQKNFRAFNQSLDRFLAGDADTSREQIEVDISRLRQLVAAMIFSLRSAPDSCMNWYVENLSVEAIETFITHEGVGMWKSREVKCWHKYRELAAGLDKTTIKHKIRQVFVQQALKSLRLPPNESGARR